MGLFETNTRRDQCVASIRGYLTNPGKHTHRNVASSRPCHSVHVRMSGLHQQGYELCSHALAPQNRDPSEAPIGNSDATARAIPRLRRTRACAVSDDDVCIRRTVEVGGGGHG